MKNLKIPQIHFKKIGIILITIIAFFICNNASALIVEIDPLTPLTDYISMAEWNTDGDFENWAYNAHIIDTQVSGGDFIGKDDGVDPVMSLDIDALTPPDARMELATTIGTVFEVRMQLVTNTLNPRIDFWATINGSGPGSFPPMQFAAAGGSVPDVLTLGEGCPFANRCENASPECHEKFPGITDLDSDHSYSCHNPITGGLK